MPAETPYILSKEGKQFHGVFLLDAMKDAGSPTLDMGLYQMVTERVSELFAGQTSLDADNLTRQLDRNLTNDYSSAGRKADIDLILDKYIDEKAVAVIRRTQAIMHEFPEIYDADIVSNYKQLKQQCDAVMEMAPQVNVDRLKANSAQILIKQNEIHNGNAGALGSSLLKLAKSYDITGGSNLGTAVGSDVHPSSPDRHVSLSEVKALSAAFQQHLKLATDDKNFTNTTRFDVSVQQDNNLSEEQKASLSEAFIMEVSFARKILKSKHGLDVKGELPAQMISSGQARTSLLLEAMIARTEGADKIAIQDIPATLSEMIKESVRQTRNPSIVDIEIPDIRDVSLQQLPKNIAPRKGSINL